MIAAKYVCLLCLSNPVSTVMVLSLPAPMVSAAVPAGPESFSIEDVIHEAADQHGVDPVLIRSMIAAESEFRSEAESDKGAIGYMQLMPETAEELGYDPTDEHQNIHAGCKYISFLIDRYKGTRNGLQKALAAYNAGPGNVDRYRGVPPFPETRNYVKRVLANYQTGFKAAERQDGHSQQ